MLNGDLLFVAVINNMTKSNLGSKGQELQQRPWRGADYWPVPHGLHEVTSFTVNSNFEHLSSFKKCPTDLPGQSDGGNSPSDVLSLQMILAHVKLTKS